MSPTEPREYASSPCMLHELDDMTGDLVTIYHNPGCSKSRETLALIREQGIEPHIVEYLKTPPDQSTLRAIVDRLKLKPEELVRHEETEFKEHFSGKTLSDDEWIKTLAEHPRLLQRPIVVRGDRAALGRPPTNVLPLIKSTSAV
jgi:arsenate reductase (glutaredoxin)